MTSPFVSSNPTPSTSPETQSKTSRPGFHYPYSDEEDDDSDSISRDTSLEIMATPPQARYNQGERTVAESFESMSVLLEDTIAHGESQVNQTNSEAGVGQQAQVHLGADKSHPIDLEDDDTDFQIESDSDVEAPDELPSTFESLRSSQSIRLSYNAEPVTTSINTPAAEQASSTAAIEDDSDYITFTPTTSEVELSEVDSASESENSSSEEDFSDDYSDEETPEEVSVLQVGTNIQFVTQSNGNSTAPGSFRPVVQVINESFRGPAPNLVPADNTQLRVSNLLQPDSQGSSYHTAPAPFDTSKLYVVPETQWGPTPRAPSPSDAALVKPPQPLRPQNPFNSPYGSLLYHTENLRTPLSGANKDGCDSSCPGGSTHTFGEEHAYATTSATHNRPFVYHAEDLMSPHPTNYEDGPFATRNLAEVGNNSSKISPSEIFLLGSQGPIDRSSLPIIMDPWQHVEFNSNALNNQIQNIQATDTVTYMQSILHAQSGASTLRQEPELRNHRHQRLSRVPISDIVNKPSAQDESPKCGLKRKAAALQETENPGSVSLDISMQTILTQDTEALDGSQGSIFHDAQPRDNVSAHDSLSDISQQSPVAATETIAVVQQDERPAKRVKTSRRTSRPFRAFVTGMVVGCATLAGVAAAFIANIPDPVRDEALAELF
jgi:hypothetical protein